MPIDPRIAMGFQPTTQLESPLNRLAKFQQIESGQRANELANMQMQEYQRGLQEQEGLRNYLAGVSDINAPGVSTGALRYGQAGAGFAETMAKRASEQAKLRETQAKTESSQFDLSRKRLAAGYQAVSSAKSGADVIAALDDGVKQGYFSQEQADAQKAEVAALQTMPEFQKWQQNKLQQLVSAEKQLEMSSPKPQQVTLADGTVKMVDVNPNSPTYKQAVQTFETGIRPGMERQLQLSQAQLDFQKKKFSETQQRLGSATKGLTEEEQTAINIGVQEGRVDPGKINGRNAKIIAGMLISNPEINLLELGVSAAGATAAERSLATQTAKMSTAANEAGKMIDVVKNLSDKVSRTEYPTINSIVNAVDKGTGGKEIVQLNTSINALVNSYARAISPTGQPTVSDKNHAREIINSAYSKGQIGAILDVMQQEMDIARHAAGTASSELKSMRETQRGRPPAETKPSTAEPGNRPSLDDIFGGKKK